MAAFIGSSAERANYWPMGPVTELWPLKKKKTLPWDTAAKTYYSKYILKLHNYPFPGLQWRRDFILHKRISWFGCCRRFLASFLSFLFPSSLAFLFSRHYVDSSFHSEILHTGREIVYTGLKLKKSEEKNGRVTCSNPLLLFSVHGRHV